jgi:WG containing repeat
MKKIVSLILISFIFLSVHAQQNYKWIIPAKYGGISFTNNGNFVARSTKSLQSKGNIFDSTGKLIVGDVSNITAYDNGIIKYQKSKSEQGCFINMQNKIVCTEWIVDALKIYGDDYVTVPGIEFLDYNNTKVALPTNFDDKKYALVNYLGNNLWTLQNKDTTKLLPSLASTCNNCGLLSKKGIVIEPIENQFIDEFQNGYALYKSPTNTYGFLKADGSFAVDTILKKECEVKLNIDGVRFYEQNNKLGILFANGKIIQPLYKTTTPQYTRGLIILQQEDGLFGAYNLNGDIAEPFVHIDLTQLLQHRENIFLVQSKGKFSFEDKNFKQVIAPKNGSAYIFYGNYAIVKNGLNKMGIINRKGELIVPYIFEDLYFLETANIFIAKQNGKEGVIKL